MQKRINLGIIGLGRAGGIHFRNIFLSNKCVLKYALDVDTARLRLFQDEYHNREIRFHSSDEYSTILDDDQLNAVIITTPTVCHEQQILMALEKGKSVFCEKPIAISQESIKRCYELAKKNNLVLHCSLNRRFDPSLQQLQRAMTNNELGRIHMIKTCSRDSPKPHVDYLKISNGIFHDCGVHDLDMICWLLKVKPKTVYATAFTNDPMIASLNDSETVVISMTFDDGTLAVIDLSRQSTYGYDQRVEIHGDRGMIESLNQRPHNVQLSNSKGTLLPPLMYSFPSRYRESYENSLNEFIDCVIEGKPSSVTVDEVLVLSQLAEACEHSCITGQMVAL